MSAKDNLKDIREHRAELADWQSELQRRIQDNREWIDNSTREKGEALQAAAVAENNIKVANTRIKEALAELEVVAKRLREFDDKIDTLAKEIGE